MNPIESRVRPVQGPLANPEAQASGTAPAQSGGQRVAGHETLMARGSPPGRDGASSGIVPRKSVSREQGEGSGSAPALPPPPVPTGSANHGGVPGSRPFVHSAVRASLLGIPV